MRRFILLAATAALITAGLDGCRRRPLQPLRPHKEPHALTLAPDRTSRPLAQGAGEAAPEEQR